MQHFGLCMLAETWQKSAGPKDGSTKATWWCRMAEVQPGQVLKSWLLTSQKQTSWQLSA